MLDKLFKKTMRLSLMLAVLGMLGACANSVVVTANIPQPLVNKLPLTASLTYTDAFKGYIYNEEEKGRALKSLSFSEAQVGMFERIFGQLVNLVKGDEVKRDFIIEPEILDFQYTAPRETKLNLYEVWLKYRLKITDDDNEKLADWTIKGYGKTPSGLFTSPSTAFNAATNIALRDVGAQLSVGFSTQDTIKTLMSGRSQLSSDLTEQASVTKTIDEPQIGAQEDELNDEAVSTTSNSEEQ